MRNLPPFCVPNVAYPSSGPLVRGNRLPGSTHSGQHRLSAVLSEQVCHLLNTNNHLPGGAAPLEPPDNKNTSHGETYFQRTLFGNASHRETHLISGCMRRNNHDYLAVQLKSISRHKPCIVAWME